MANPKMMNAIEEVERIINYHFKIRALLSEALQPSSAPHPQGENQAFLALAGQRALEATSWRKFCTINNAKDVTLADLDGAIAVHQELHGDANLLRVAHQSRLHMYIATGLDVVSSRVRAILGAVWLDSQKHLEQVTKVSEHPAIRFA